MIRITRKSGRNRVRRFWAGATLIAYVLTIFGVPLPCARAKDRSIPFPCQNHACGCASAQACWSNCCCYSPEEKLAWARANGVAPPSYAEPAESGAWRTDRLRDRKEPQASGCCAQQAEEEASATPSCQSCCANCGKTASCQTVPTLRAKSSSCKSSVASRWLAGMSALQCRGASTLWVSAGVVLPPPLVQNWSPSLMPTAWIASLEASSFFVPRTPPAPPPRFHLS